MDAAKNAVGEPVAIQQSWMMQTVLMRLVIWGSAAVALVVFWFAGEWFGIPYVRGYAASLLQGSAVANVIVVAVIYLAIVAAAGALLGRVRPGIGVFAAAFGLAAISLRGGTVSDLLRDHGASAAYGMMLGETVLLAVVAMLGMMAARFLAPPPPLAEVNDQTPQITDKLLSVGLQTAVTIVLMLVLGQSDAKGQALAAVGAASMVATLIADNMLPVGFTPFAVIAPFIAALAGYLWAMTTGGDTDPANALATALPLDYAGFGVAGTMLAHWMSQQWREEGDGEG